MDEIENPEMFLEGIQPGETVEFVIEGRSVYRPRTRPRGGDPVFRRVGRPPWRISFGHSGADSIGSLGRPLRYIIQAWNMMFRKEGKCLTVVAGFRSGGRPIKDDLREWFAKRDSDGIQRYGQYGDGWPEGVSRIVFVLTEIKTS